MDLDLGVNDLEGKQSDDGGIYGIEDHWLKEVVRAKIGVVAWGFTTPPRPVLCCG